MGELRPFRVWFNGGNHSDQIAESPEEARRGPWNPSFGSVMNVVSRQTLLTWDDEAFNKAFDIAVQSLGATEDLREEARLSLADQFFRHGTGEFRCLSSLGFGGKLCVETNYDAYLPQFYFSAYKEDLTNPRTELPNQRSGLLMRANKKIGANYAHP